MITSVQILEELNRRLAETYKEAFCYIDHCPAQFQRPCFLLEFISEEQQAATRVSVKKTSVFSLTYYGKVDGYSDASTEELLAVQDGLQALAGPGYLRMGGRALPVQSGKGERGPDWVKLELTFAYFDDRPVPEGEEETAEKMKEIHTKIIEGGIKNGTSQH